jgi:iron(III) transport system substrate-binding protein
MKFSRRAFLSAGTAAAAISLGKWQQPAAAQFWFRRGPSVNLYTARHYDTDESLYEAFREATGVRVNVIEAEADQLIERIKGEAS